MRHLVLNLKANFLKEDILKYKDELAKINMEGLDVIVCPSPLYFDYFNLRSITLGAQNISEYDNGPFTGEITASQYASMNAKYAIVGHYERKRYFHETRNTLVAKIKNALKANLKVIYCIGESENDLKNNEVIVSLEGQIANVLNEFNSEELKNIIIAYEPYWAIGTNKLPQMNDIKETINFIKRLINSYYHIDLKVLYGGSINRANIILLRGIKNIDGFMVGNTSLDIKELNRIVELLKIDKN